MRDMLDMMQQNLGIINILIEVFSIVIFVIICLDIFFGIWKNRAEKYTRNQIEQLMNVHKYIPNLFVEIGDTKDIFRFFVFGKKWKSKIIQRFNAIYANFYGHILQQKYLKTRFPNIKFKLKRNLSIKKMLSCLNENIRFHKSFKPNNQNEPCFHKEDQATEFWFEYHSYKYEEKLAELQMSVKMMSERYVILIGNAGNGKTNLLCSLSNLMSRNHIPNLFINAKDIPIEPISWFCDLLCISKIKNEYFRKVILFLINLNLCLNCQYFFILVDAINENDSPSFDKIITKFLNTLLRYGRIKVLVTCRSEFFEYKFKQLLENINDEKPLVYKLQQERYSEENIDYLLKVYKEWFNFQGYIYPLVVHKLTTQLLLMRIFFEVYQNTNQNIISLEKSQIFKFYIENIQKNITFNLSKILKKIIDKMIERSQYNGIPLEVCQLSDDELKDIKKIEDHCILFGEKIESHKNTVLEREITMLYFVYDELRDYLLSRNILEGCLDVNYHLDIDLVQSKIQSIYDSHSPIVEGVLKYSYSCFKKDLDLLSEERRKLCCYILGICKPNHLSLGKEIILNTDSILENFERDFISEILEVYPDNIVDLLFEFVNSDINGGIYKLKELLDMLCKINNRKILSQIANCLFKDNRIIRLEEELQDIDTDKHILATYQKIMVLFSSVMRNDLKYTNITCHFLNLREASIWIRELKQQMDIDL